MIFMMKNEYDFKIYIYYSDGDSVKSESKEGNKEMLVTKEHLKKAFENAKPSLNTDTRYQYERIYASFAEDRTTDFTPATNEMDKTRLALM